MLLCSLVVCGSSSEITRAIPQAGVQTLLPFLLLRAEAGQWTETAAPLNSLYLRIRCLAHSFPLLLLLMILLVWSQAWRLSYIDNIAEYKYFK